MGGTWTGENKIRPGVYVNFEQTSIQPDVSRRGIVTLPLDLAWGSEQQVIEITGDMNTTSIFGDVIENILPLNEALKRAEKVLAYRLNPASGANASGILGNLTATAKYTGETGNDIQVVIEVNGAAFDVKTYFKNQMVDEQESAANAEDLQDNDYVVFSGTGVLAADAGKTLTGGSSAGITASEYSAFRLALEAYEWNVCALYDVTDSAIKSAFKEWVERLRDQEGKKVICVMNDYSTADYEGIISVKNGVVLSDAAVLTGEKAVAWVAGAAAAADTDESLTYDSYDGAVDVDIKYSNSEIESAIEEGQMVFVSSNNKARVEYDINTLHTFTPEKGKMFRKNQVVRVLDTINNDIIKICEDYFIGKVNNNDDGRNLLKNQIIKYLQRLLDKGSIKNFDTKTDVEVLMGVDSDSVVVNTAVQPADSIEKIYITVEVK